VEFAEAAAPELPLLQAAAKALQGREYLRSVVRVYDEKDFLPIYLERGYLKAAFADAQPKIVQETPEETIVDVTVSVTPGLQYRMSDLQLSGYKAFEADNLRGLITSNPVSPPILSNSRRILMRSRISTGLADIWPHRSNRNRNLMMRTRLFATCSSSMKVMCTKWETWKSMVSTVELRPDG